MNATKLDSYDLKLIALLQEEGRLPITEAAKRIGISKSPAQARLKRLLNTGVISGFRAVVDHAQLQQEHVAFAEVKLSDTRESALASFNKAVAAIPEIEECHLIAGAFDYLMKVRTKNISAYRKVLGESISGLPHVASTSTHVSMQSIKETA